MACQCGCGSSAPAPDAQTASDHESREQELARQVAELEARVRELETAAAA